MINPLPVIKMIAVLIIVLLVLGALWYVTGLRADLAVSQENSKKLEDAVNTQKETIAQQRQDAAAVISATQAMSRLVEKQNQDLSNLQDRFNQSSATGKPRDFGAAAAEKPEAVQRAVNRGSDAAFRCLELASGAEHSPLELAAVTPEAVNRECTELANPNYKPGATK
jgi:hypothetical protein